MSTTYVNDITITTQIVAVDCGEPGCGLVYGLSSEFIAARRKDHRGWYCPNGHSRYYPQKTEAEKLKEQLAAARSLAQREADRRRSADYQARAYKGHATRLRNRIAEGFCPAGCDQQFPDIQGHLTTEHPDFNLPGDGA